MQFLFFSTYTRHNPVDFEIVSLSLIKQERESGSVSPKLISSKLVLEMASIPRLPYSTHSSLITCIAFIIMACEVFEVMKLKYMFCMQVQ